MGVQCRSLGGEHTTTHSWNSVTRTHQTLVSERKYRGSACFETRHLVKKKHLCRRLEECLPVSPDHLGYGFLLPIQVEGLRTQPLTRIAWRSNLSPSSSPRSSLDCWLGSTSSYDMEAAALTWKQQL